MIVRQAAREQHVLNPSSAKYLLAIFITNWYTASNTNPIQSTHSKHKVFVKVSSKYVYYACA